MTWLTGVTVDREGAPQDSWPWTLSAVAAMESVDLAQPVTFLTGENGSGKSTVLETLAVATGCPVGGGPSNRWLKGPGGRYGLPSRSTPRWRAKPVGGAFFLRAETYFDLTTQAQERIKADRPTLEDAQLLEVYDGWSPHELSHGQSFLQLFAGRMRGESLWFMDEPEAPLSFSSCLGLLATVHDLVAAGAQLVIATHSPVLLAFPGAAIYELTDDGLERVAWDDCDVVVQTRAFLTEPALYLRHLLT